MKSPTWTDDTGSDGEDYPLDGRRMFHYAPSQKSLNDIFLGSSGIDDGAAATLLNLTPNELNILKLDICRELRKPVGFAATEDYSFMTRILCKKGETPLGWQLSTSNKIFAAALSRNKLAIILKHKNIFYQPTTIDEDGILNDVGRFTITPYFYRIMVLDRLFSSCATHMKKRAGHYNDETRLTVNRDERDQLTSLFTLINGEYFGPKFNKAQSMSAQTIQQANKEPILLQRGLTVVHVDGFERYKITSPYKIDGSINTVGLSDVWNSLHELGCKLARRDYKFEWEHLSVV